MKKPLAIGLNLALALLVYDFEFLIQLRDRSYTSCHASATGTNGVEAREKALRECRTEIAEGAKLSATILKASRPAGPGPEPELDELNLIEEGGT